MVARFAAVVVFAVPACVHAISAQLIDGRFRFEPAKNWRNRASFPGVRKSEQRRLNSAESFPFNDAAAMFAPTFDCPILGQRRGFVFDDLRHRFRQGAESFGRCFVDIARRFCRHWRTNQRRG